jgi:serine/threonine protein kinase
MIKNFKTGRLVMKGGSIGKKIIEKRKIIQQLGGVELDKLPREQPDTCNVPEYVFREKVQFHQTEAAWGHIYIVCINNNCNYIAKVQLFQDNPNIPQFIITPKNIFRNEVEIYKKIQKGYSALLAPILHDAWVCKDPGYPAPLGYMLMDNWTNIPLSGNLTSIKNKSSIPLQWSVFKTLLSKYSILHNKLFIVHGDVRENNILWRIEDGRLRFVLIDFGFSKDYQLSGEVETEHYYLMVLLDYLKLLIIISNLLDKNNIPIAKNEVIKGPYGDEMNIVAIKIVNVEIIKDIMSLLDNDLRNNHYYIAKRESIQRDLIKGHDILFGYPRPMFLK